MKRICMAHVAACAAVILAAGVSPGTLWAASPEVDAAIKAFEAVGKDAGKLKQFCELNRLLQETGDTQDPATQKKVEDLIAQVGPDFSAAWDVGDALDENSEDGQRFYAAVDALAEKCQ